MRATWLTDIHLNFPLPRALKSFYAAVKAEAPDVVLVTGDIAEADAVARLVRTGGWDADEEDYGNPIVQATLVL